MADTVRARLAKLRRDPHRHPEPGWCEFRTTARLVKELRAVGVDELAVGADVHDPADRMAIPSDDRFDEWYERALDRGTDPELFEPLRGGMIGCVAVLDHGEGPTAGLRVDIDGLFIEESDDAGHDPAAEGFRSEMSETMYVCGRDTHMTRGLVALEAVKESDFSGRLAVFFQPTEEVPGGGAPMAKSERAAGINYFFAVHVGLDHPTGETVAGIEKPLAMCHIDAEIEGTIAHTGKASEAGANATHALGTAIESICGTPRHSDGMTRVNVGRVEGGTTSNVITDKVEVVAEARGETTELMKYTKSELRRRFEKAAELHGCEAIVDVVSESPRTDSDPEFVEAVADAAETVGSVNRVVQTADFSASEDVMFLMERVQRDGGFARYSIAGIDYPTSHYTAAFDVDERNLEAGVDVLTRSILSVAGFESAPTAGARVNR